MAIERSPQINLNNLRYDKILPFSEAGFGLLQNTYGGGRIGCLVNHFGGLTRVEYWGNMPMHLPNIFFAGDPTSSYVRCFRPEVVVGGEAYMLEFSSTYHFPFGYRSDFSIPKMGIDLRHRLTLIDDALVFSIEVLCNKNKLPISQRFEHHGHTFHQFPERTSTTWQKGIVPSGWVLTATDRIGDAKWTEFQDELRLKPDAKYPPAFNQGPREGTAWIAVLGERGMEMRETKMGRIYWDGGEFRGGTHATAVLFAPSRQQLVSRAVILAKSGAAMAKKAEDECERDLERAPQFHSGDRILDSMIANVPAVYKSFFISDLPGTAMGASVGYYVWGWDTINCADVHLLSGQTAFAHDVLDYYRKTADPNRGIAHQFTTDFPPKIRVSMPFGAQMVYVMFLHQYGALTGDRAAWSEFFPFAKWIFEKCLERIDGRGLGIGHALWPDYPDSCGHTGHDISVFNNSIQYQGVRCIEQMAAYCGDKATRAEAERICRLMEKNFLPTFWDEKRGYFVDSVDELTGEQRCSYPAHALLWMTPFLHDLVDREKLKACAKFHDENHKALRGWLPYPRWDQAFDGDGNQLGQIWPQQDMFITRCAAIAGRLDVLDLWNQNSDWFWKQVTYLEGYSAQTVNDSGTPDRPGSKMNFFGTKTTYMTFFVGLAGIHFDTGGVTLSEGIARPMSIDRVPFRTAKLDLKLSGKGRFSRILTVNGKSVVGSLKVPTPLLKGRVKVVHERTDKAPSHPIIRSIYGAELLKVEIKNNTLIAVVGGTVPAWLHYYSRKPVRVYVNGEEISGDYNAQTGEGKVLLPLDSSRAKLVVEP